MGLKLIGAGFGRTGTKSIQAALEQLGLAPCYHMSEVFENPAHARVWRAAAEGEAADLQALLQGYQAAVDWPACSFYRELMALYPDAKVLLTLRDPEPWYDSVQKTIYGVNHAIPERARRLASILPKGEILKMIDRLLWENTFAGRFTEREFAIAAFNRHNAAVQAHVPAERLLVYRVQEGWAPLCQFLNRPVPDAPFPRLNDASAFQKRRRVA
jgi:hypothetical protein